MVCQVRLLVCVVASQQGIRQKMLVVSVDKFGGFVVQIVIGFYVTIGVWLIYENLRLRLGRLGCRFATRKGTV